MEDENVTMRRHKTIANDSTDLSFESINSEIRRFSLPDLSTGYDSDEEDLKDEIVKLKIELESAHQEIEKLVQENMMLKNALDRQRNKSKNLQKICSEPRKKTTNTTREKRNKEISRNMSLSFAEGLNTSSIDLGLNNEASEIITDGATCKTLEPTQHNFDSDTVTKSFCKNPVDDKMKIDVATSSSSKLMTPELKPNKLCIISSNQTNRILSIAQNTFPSHNICHYLLTNYGTKQLINNLDKKLLDYTKNDYCLIFIGDRDFTKTHNYFELIINIRNTLLTLQHTNVVLCLPTYKFNGYSSMFNSRIETFGNLLCHDVYTYDYAIIFDSNLNLTYDDTMFNKRTGIVNNYGMKNIFDNLKYYINADLIHSEESKGVSSITFTNIKKQNTNNQLFLG